MLKRQTLDTKLTKIIIPITGRHDLPCITHYWCKQLAQMGQLLLRLHFELGRVSDQNVDII